MYQQLILEHAKSPIGRITELSNEATPGSGFSHQINPTCGDEISLLVTTDSGKIADVKWSGHGCSISQASASIMSDLVTGESFESEANQSRLFHELMNSRGQGLPVADEDKLGDAVAFTGVSLFPARIKCALLGWAALKDALAKAQAKQEAN